MGSMGTSASTATFAIGIARPLKRLVGFSDCQKPFDNPYDLARLKFALPNHYNHPSCAPQRAGILMVSFAVTLALGSPECGVSHGRTAAPLASMHVPVASVNEYDGMARRHNDIGFARQIGAVEGKAETETMQNRTHSTFGRRVLAANRGHTLAALRGGERVAHGAYLTCRPRPYRISLRGNDTLQVVCLGATCG
jgi:hypothetical protein